MTANEKGTSFWHAHSGIQRGDGIFGPLIVRQNQINNRHFDAYDFDLSEHVLTLNDWINDPFVAKFVQHVHSNGTNKPESILINGRGVYYSNQPTSTNVIETPRAVFAVQRGFKYRFRIINAGLLYCPIQFSIDGHNLILIASDTHDIEPITVQVINILAGNFVD